MPTALVTGATGLVGSHVVERLARDGWEVRALVRDRERARWLEPLGAALHSGDLFDAERLGNAAAGCDALFHSAAQIVGRGGWESFRRANVEGTDAAVRAAERAGARLLHVSSVAVYGGTRATGAALDERSPLQPLRPGAHYARSKRESEALVLGAHRDGRLWGTAIRPCVVYGVRDRQLVPRLARLYATGFSPLLAGGRSALPVVHAANVADAAVRAALTDRAGGNAYNVANDFPVTTREWLRLAARGLDRRITPVPVPMPLARAGILAVKAAAALVRGGSASAMAGATLDFLSRDNPYVSDRARADFGWAPTVRPDEGVPDAFRWWRERGDG